MTAGKQEGLASTAGAMTHQVKQVQRDRVDYGPQGSLRLKQGGQVALWNLAGFIQPRRQWHEEKNLAKPRNVGQGSFQDATASSKI